MLCARDFSCTHLLLRTLLLIENARKGTSARQVHDVIQGYDEVRHCDFDDVEIYSYYSGGAVMGIYYTPDGNLDRVRVYDDSESYSWESCRPGQRPE